MVQEKNGRFSGKGIWKLPTGAVNEVYMLKIYLLLIVKLLKD